jgi:glyceraldehyde 3-phosphate dehydrogenase
MAEFGREEEIFMSVRVGINGFGRIGRSFARVLLDRQPPGAIEIVAINEPSAAPDTLAYLLEHDSVAGRLGVGVEATEHSLRVDGQDIAVSEYAQPTEIPWSDHDVEVVVEASGHFRSRAAAAGHLEAGARRVIISAPGKAVDLTVCIGVNEDAYDPAAHIVVSNASCTTNCLAPMARVLDERFGITQGFMTTVHAYTSDQALLDQARSGRGDLRRMRAAAVSIVPTTTGASRAVGEVLPQLAGRLDGIALRVPVPVGSIVDLVATLQRDATIEAVNSAFADAEHDKSYRGVLEYTEKPLVSQDIVGNPASCVFSARDTMASGRVVKVLGWYDNEWGYANRLVDLVELMAG